MLSLCCAVILLDSCGAFSQIITNLLAQSKNLLQSELNKHIHQDHQWPA